MSHRCTQAQSKLLAELIEGAAKVTQRVARMQRYGAEGSLLSQIHPNRTHLSLEVGDLMAALHLAIEEGLLCVDTIELGWERKLERQQRWPENGDSHGEH